MNETLFFMQKATEKIPVALDYIDLKKQ